MRRGRRAFLLAAGAALLLVGVSAAAPGDLDPSFGGNGIVTTRFGDEKATADGLVVQGDGRLVAAGSAWRGYSVSDFALARYNRDGSLDRSFGRDGKVRLQSAAYDGARALMVQEDGKPVAAGWIEDESGSDFALVRYNRDGSLDTSFGGDGIVRTEIGSYSYAEGLVLQTDGKLVAAGSSGVQFALARYHPDGSLDTTFGREGKVRSAIPGGALGWALALQADGKLLVAGESADGFTLARYKPNGRLDRGFGDSGIVTTPISGDIDDAKALALQGDGKIVAAGETWNGDDYDFALVRYKPDGRLDRSFGGDGKVTTDLGPGSGDSAHAVVVHSDGKIVASGNKGSEFALVRYNPDGSLDTSFGGDGIVTTSLRGYAHSFALDVDADGKLLAGGESFIGFALARYDG